MKKIVKILSALLVMIMVVSMLAACTPPANNGGNNETPSTNGGSNNNNNNNNNNNGDNGDPNADTTVMLSPNSGKTFVFNIWGAKQDQEMLKKMCNEWAAKNPQNKYTFLFGEQEENNTAAMVLNDVTAGPDIYSFPSDQINSLFSGGALARVGGAVEANVKATNEADAVDAATLNIGGQDMLYAYPSTGDNCYFVYYDKRVYSEDDVKSLDTMLDKAKEAGKQVHFKLNNDGWYLSSFFFSKSELAYKVTYDEYMAETKIEINFDEPAGLDVMKSLKKYVYHDGLLTSTDDSVILNAFSEGTAAAAITGTWNAKNIEEKLGAENVGVCKLPTAEIGGEQIQLSGYKGYKLIGVNDACPAEKKGEAHYLARWLTNEQNQITRYETRDFRPTNINALKNEKIVADPIMKVVEEQFQYNRTQKGVPSSYWTPMGQLIAPIVNARAAGEDITEAELREALETTCASIRK